MGDNRFSNNGSIHIDRHKPPLTIAATVDPVALGWILEEDHYRYRLNGHTLKRSHWCWMINKADEPGQICTDDRLAAVTAAITEEQIFIEAAVTEPEEYQPNFNSTPWAGEPICGDGPEWW